jgi:hypothetical protein
LVTGDRVTVRTDAHGRQQVSARRPDGSRGGFSVLRLDGDLYVIPTTAVPYLGRSLDRALFDVSALLRDGSTAQTPVRVSFAPGAAQVVPGVTLTGPATAGGRVGYLPRAAAAQFGAALDTQYANDLRAGWAGDRRLFGGVTSIRYGGRGPASVVRPDFPMVTVKINVLGLHGEPAPIGLLGVTNTDNALKYGGIPLVVNGEARISVPLGHYSALLSYDSGSTPADLATNVVVGDFEVTGPTTITLDARRATTRPTFSTHRPSTFQDALFTWTRGAADGSGFTFLGLTVFPLAVSPTPVPAIGTQSWSVHATLSGPDSAPVRYDYDVQPPPTADIPAVQHYRFGPDNLATLHETYASDVSATGLVSRFDAEPEDLIVFGLPHDTRLREPHIEYVSARPDLTHQEAVATSDDFNAVFAGMLNARRVFRPGQHASEEWFRGPIAPGFPQDPGEDRFGVLCNACRSGDTLTVAPLPMTDSTPDHYGLLDFPIDGVTTTSRFQLLSGGTVLADIPDTNGGDFPVPPQNAPYKVVYDQTRIAPWYATSPVSHTEWTFRSGHSATQTVPDTVVCAGADCSGVPLLTLDYRLPASLRNTMRPGPVTMDLTVRHAPYTAQVPVGRATVAVSFDGGASFRPVRVRPLGHGRFRAQWVNPRHAGPVALRVGAADVAGSTVDQTVRGAYVIEDGVSTLAGDTRPAAPGAGKQPATRDACGAVSGPGQARCLARFRHGGLVHSRAATLPAGYGPADLRSAYALPATTSTKTVAVVLAFDYPTAEADLAVYRRTFGLPPCTAANGCFRKVNQHGAATPLPEPDAGWALEAALDMQMVSASCPTCKIILVEADDNFIESLAVGVDSAVALGASVVSNSYSADESGEDLPIAASYNHPGVPILASSGDLGFGFTAAQSPAVLPGVIGIGGTTLTRDSSARGWTEQVWAGAGSGCSAWWDKPGWQHDPNCAMRTVADISAVADPETGVAVYDTFGLGPDTGWLILGGTSVSSPFLAGVIASTGHPERVTAQTLYGKKPSAYNDVVGGSNGFCGGDYLCTGLPGYDAPSGLGTPHGLAAFR